MGLPTPHAIIHFRTRGGPTQGWGNIYRLASFAALCRRNQPNSMSRFFVEGPPSVHRYLRGCGFSVVPLPEEVSLAEERRIVSRFPVSDLTVVEMLDCHLGRQNLLRRRTRRLVVFDDLLDHPYSADVVVCGQRLPRYGNRSISHPRTRFLLGYRYFMMRPEFQPFHDRPRVYSRQVRRVLVSLGGGRYQTALWKTAEALSAFGNVRATFVLGNDHADSLAREIRARLPRARVVGGVKHLERLFWNADLAVVSGGYGKLEAAVTGTPAVVIPTQWHQIPLAREFCRRARAPLADYMSFTTSAILVELLNRLSSRTSRQQLGNRMKAMIDGEGMSRVYSSIFGD